MCHRSLLILFYNKTMANNSGRKVYVVGVGMSKFIKPRGLIDYPGKKKSVYISKSCLYSCMQIPL